MLEIWYRNLLFTVLKYAVLFVLGFFFGRIYFANLEICKHIEPQSQFKNSVSSSSKVKPASLVIIIFSAPTPNNKLRRQMIRKTWLLTKGNLNIRYFFVIGSASLSAKEKRNLQMEDSQHEDLLLLEKMKDSFRKLSQKLLEAFRWLDTNLHFDFLLKVDDDSFVRLDALYSKMLTLPKEKLYWGFFSGTTTVQRKGKYEENDWFLCDLYLPYAKGGGYIVTGDLIKKIVVMSEMLTLYQNEDVSIGTWLAPFLIQRLHDPQFDTEYISRGCNNAYLVTHKQSTDMMVFKYKNLLKFGTMCWQEFKSRYSYVYNWDAPASFCCYRNDSKIP